MDFGEKSIDAAFCRLLWLVGHWKLFWKVFQVTETTALVIIWQDNDNLYNDDNVGDYYDDDQIANNCDGLQIHILQLIQHFLRSVYFCASLGIKTANIRGVSFYPGT